MNQTNQTERWKELADKAQRGLSGQGAIVEAHRFAVVAMQDLTRAVQTTGECTATQNTQMLSLNYSIRTLTGVVVVISLVQVGLAIWGG